MKLVGIRTGRTVAVAVRLGDRVTPLADAVLARVTGTVAVTAVSARA